MNFLVGQGIPATRITTVSYGEERPGCSKKNAACWTSNRRPHLLLKPG